MNLDDDDQYLTHEPISRTGIPFRLMAFPYRTYTGVTMKGV